MESSMNKSYFEYLVPTAAESIEIANIKQPTIHGCVPKNGDLQLFFRDGIQRIQYLGFNKRK